MSRRRRRGLPTRPVVSAAATRARLPIIDGMRGFALCLMLVYHFAFDLTWFRVFRADFNNDPFWLGFRAVIVTLFLGLVGVSLVLARRARPAAGPFWRRVALITVCAVLVSVASYITFPQTFITFGILHCIAVSSVLARPLVDFPRTALAVGIAIIAAGTAVHLPVFDNPWLNWVGLMTHKPPTEDYVPLFPWLGVVLVGAALGSWMIAHKQRALHAWGRATPLWLAWAGRHSLLIYMLHQPLLVGILRVVL